VTHNRRLRWFDHGEHGGTWGQGDAGPHRKIGRERKRTLAASPWYPAPNPSCPQVPRGFSFHVPGTRGSPIDDTGGSTLHPRGDPCEHQERWHLLVKPALLPEGRNSEPTIRGDGFTTGNAGSARRGQVTLGPDRRFSLSPPWPFQRDSKRIATAGRPRTVHPLGEATMGGVAGRAARLFAGLEGRARAEAQRRREDQRKSRSARNSVRPRRRGKREHENTKP